MGLSVWRETSKKLTVCREKGKKLTVCRDYFCSDNRVVCISGPIPGDQVPSCEVRSILRSCVLPHNLKLIDGIKLAPGNCPLNTKTRYKRDSSAPCFSSSELIFKDGVLIEHVLRCLLHKLFYRSGYF